jgi:hypothetical protein
LVARKREAKKTPTTALSTTGTGRAGRHDHSGLTGVALVSKSVFGKRQGGERRTEVRRETTKS